MKAQKPHFSENKTKIQNPKSLEHRPTLSPTLVAPSVRLGHGVPNLESPGLGSYHMVSSLSLGPRMCERGARSPHLPGGGADRRRGPLAPGPPLRTPSPASPLAASPAAHLGQHAPRPPPGHGCARAGLGSEPPGTPEDPAPTARHGQGRRRELFHPATSGGRHTRPAGRLSTPAAMSAPQNETATAWSREESPRPLAGTREARLPWGASPARPARPEDRGPTPLRRPPASPLPPTRALESGRCAGRRRGHKRAGRRVRQTR